MKNKKPLAAFWLSVCLALTACVPPVGARREAKVYTIATADSTGTMYPAGLALAEVLGASLEGAQFTVSASTGSVMNVRNLAAGEVDLALVTADVLYAATSGTGEFAGEGLRGLRAIGACYASVSTWIAPVSSGVRYVHDLGGETIGVGPGSSATEYTALASLSACGITADTAALENFALGTAAGKLLTGELGAAHAFAGVPIPDIQQSAKDGELRILRYTAEEVAAILAENPWYFRTTLPAGTYAGQTAAIPTFGVKCILCVRETMPDEEAYAIARALSENREALAAALQPLGSMQDDSFFTNDLSVALHRGARQYYVENAML